MPTTRLILLLGLLLSGVASAQVTITTSTNLGDALVGVGAAGGKLTVASANTNYDLNPTSLAVVGSYSNSGNVIDIGKTSDGLGTIELHSNGTFTIYSDSDRFVLFSGDVSSHTSGVWGISDSFWVGSSEYVWIGINDSSPNRYLLSIYNLTTSTFSLGWASYGEVPPTGLSVYPSTNGDPSDPYYFRHLVAVSGAAPVTVVDKGTYYYNSGGAVYFDASSISDVTDVATHNGQIFAVSSNGVVEYGAYPLRSVEGLSGGAAVPEPSTYAALFGLTALGFVAYRRRKQPVA